MPGKDKLSAATAALILLAGISALGLIVPRTYGPLLFLSYTSSFFAYFWLCRFNTGFIPILLLGITCRIILMAGMPLLSDDVYRFIWDGHLLNAGMSPYAVVPSEFIKTNSQIPGITNELYHQLNSPEYYTVYPPLNQLIFWLSVQAGSSWLLSANIIRIVLLLAEIGSFLLLRKLLILKKMVPSLADWYFLNPLVILEITGNLHFEGLVIFFLLCSLYLLYKRTIIFSGVVLGMAIAAKILPLIYLPPLFLHGKIKQGILLCMTALLVAVITFLPMLSPDLVQGISSSLELYIHKFEFNASLYFLLREVGFWITGYNVISILGPALSMTTLLLITGLAVYARKHHWQPETTLLFTLTIYLVMATTVHPWYILPLIALGLLSGFYFPIIWSLTIFVTYFGYTPEGFELAGGWLVFEYTTLFAAITWELNYKRSR